MRTSEPAASEPKPIRVRKGSGDAVWGRRPDFLDRAVPELLVAAFGSDAEPLWFVADGAADWSAATPLDGVEDWFWSGEAEFVVAALLPLDPVLLDVLDCANTKAVASSNRPSNMKSRFIDRVLPFVFVCPVVRPPGQVEG